MGPCLNHRRLGLRGSFQNPLDVVLHHRVADQVQMHYELPRTSNRRGEGGEKVTIVIGIGIVNKALVIARQLFHEPSAGLGTRDDIGGSVRENERNGH